MKKYVFKDLGETWWAEYQVDGMQTTDNQKVLGIRSRSVGGAINSTGLDAAMTAIGLPNHYGVAFTEVAWKALAVANNLTLTMVYESLAGVVKSTALNTAAEVLTFSFLDGPNAALTADAVGVVNSTLGTIAVTVPNGSVVTALIATFTLSSGASAKISTTAQVSGTTPNSFAAPKAYIVTSAHGETKTFTVTVTVA